MGNHSFLKRGLVFQQGALIAMRGRPAPKSDRSKMNQKQLEQKLEQMHQEMISELRALKEALVLALQSGVATAQQPPIMGKHSGVGHPGYQNPAVQMDESTFVTDVDISDVEKMYQEDLMKVDSHKDEHLEGSKSKLRNLKKRK